MDSAASQDRHGPSKTSSNNTAKATNTVDNSQTTAVADAVTQAGETSAVQAL